MHVYLKFCKFFFFFFRNLSYYRCQWSLLENEKEEDTAGEEENNSEAVSPLHVEECDCVR